MSANGGGSQSTGRMAGSKERLLVAAAQLARERGLDGATISALCRRSGLPVSSVYWHFTDKDALFAEVIRTDFERWLADGPDWTPHLERDFVTDLRGIFTTASEHTVTQTPDFFRIGMQLVLDQRATHERARAEFLRIRSEVSTMMTSWCLARLIEEGLPDAAALAARVGSLMLAFGDGVIVGSEIYEDEGFGEYLELFIQAVAAMVAAPASA